MVWPCRELEVQTFESPLDRIERPKAVGPAAVADEVMAGYHDMFEQSSSPPHSLHCYTLCALNIHLEKSDAADAELACEGVQ
jgi:hypothetical protein